MGATHDQGHQDRHARVLPVPPRLAVRVIPALLKILSVSGLEGVVLGITYDRFGVSTTSQRVSAVLRYRITIEVQVGGRTLGGSAVQEVGYYIIPLPLTGKTTKLYLRGEALVIDLGGCGYILPLIDRMYTVVSASCLRAEDYHQRGGSTIKDVVARQMASARPCLPPNRDNLLLLSSPDFSTPDNLSVAGAGMLVSAQIETTNDPLTTGIEHILTWLAQPRAPPPERWLDVGGYNRQKLGMKDFIRRGFR